MIRRDGALQFGDLVIPLRVPEQALIDMAGNRLRPNWQTRSGSATSYVLELDGVGSVTLYFKQGALVMADLFYHLEPEEKPSWDTWSEAKELARKARHDKLLREWLGEPPYSYVWGEAGSFYDSKGGFAVISVRYRVWPDNGTPV